MKADCRLRARNMALQSLWLLCLTHVGNCIAVPLVIVHT